MTGLNELPHQPYAEAVAEGLDKPSGPYAPDEWLAERYADGTLAATYYFRHTQPRTVQRDPDFRDLDVTLEPVVDAEEWPYGVAVLWTSKAGWEYGPLSDEFAEGAHFYEPLPVDPLAAPAALRSVLPALFAGATDQLPASTDRWNEPGRSDQLAAYLALPPQKAAPTTEENEMTDPETLFMAAQTQRPADVPAGTALSVLVAKRSAAGQRLLNNLLPEDFPHQVERGTAGDALTQLAVGEVIRRSVRNERCSTVWEALRLGATWEQVADALDTTELAAADDLRVWAEGQRTLFHQLLAENPDNRIGLDEDAFAEVMRQVAFAFGRVAVDARDTIAQQKTARLRAAVAAAPMVDTVGGMRALLEQLPDEMPLSLDDHHRSLRSLLDEPNQVYTVHPSLVASVAGLGTPAESKQPGLLLTQVYVPFPADEEEQAAVATRDDLPAYGELPRAAHYLERGELRPGLMDAAGVLDEVAHLVGEVAAGYVETGSDGKAALEVEAERITHAAARVRTLAGQVEAAE